MPTNQPYVADHKRWDHQGNVIPQVEYSKSERPHGEYLPAPWLPLDEAGGFYDKYFEEYMSIMPGKVLAMSRDGKIVPAGLMRKYKAAGSGDTVLTYTATDLAEKVVDLTTGEYVASATSYTKAQVETALRDQGLLGSAENLEYFVSSPVAVAPYASFNAMSHSDPNNPADLRKHNFNIQHRIAVLCDYVLELPWVPEVIASQTASTVGDVTDYTATQTNTYYLQFTDTAKLPIAPSTLRTTWTFGNDASSLFTNKKVRIRDVKATGDYFIDDALDRLYFHHGGNLAAAQAAADPVTITFYHYQSSDDANITSEFACVVGPIKEGDYLKPTTKSNYQPVTQAHGQFALSTPVGASFNQTELQGLFDELETNAEEQAQIIGQVLDIEEHPKGALDLVRSYGNSLPASLYTDKMPGTATEGLPDKLTYAGGANKVVRVNIIRK